MFEVVLDFFFLNQQKQQQRPTAHRVLTPRGSIGSPRSFMLTTSPLVHEYTDPSSPALSTLSLSLPLPSPALSKLAPCHHNERRYCWTPSSTPPCCLSKTATAYNRPVLPAQARLGHDPLGPSSCLAAPTSSPLPQGSCAMARRAMGCCYLCR